MLMYFIGMSAVWALTERIGHVEHIDAGRLSLALSGSALANMAGSLLVALVAHRLGTFAGLAVGFVTTALGLLLLATGHEWLTFLAGVCLFFFAWGFHFPFLFRLLAEVDKEGGVAVLIPLMTGGGFTVGPAIGGLLLAAGGAPAVCAAGAVCVVASTLGAAALNSHKIKKEAVS
jgi:MFS family permease